MNLCKKCGVRRIKEPKDICSVCSEEIVKKLTEVIVTVFRGVPILFEVFYRELNKTDLSDDDKKLVENCFSLGVASALCLEVRKKLSEKGV